MFKNTIRKDAIYKRKQFKAFAVAFAVFMCGGGLSGGAGGASDPVSATQGDAAGAVERDITSANNAVDFDHKLDDYAPLKK